MQLQNHHSHGQCADTCHGSVRTYRESHHTQQGASRSMWGATPFRQSGAWHPKTAGSKGAHASTRARAHAARGVYLNAGTWFFNSVVARRPAWRARTTGGTLEAWTDMSGVGKGERFAPDVCVVGVSKGQGRTFAGGQCFFNDSSDNVPCASASDR